MSKDRFKKIFLVIKEIIEPKILNLFTIIF